jgi:hypothetical protein
VQQFYEIGINKILQHGLGQIQANLMRFRTFCVAYRAVGVPRATEAHPFKHQCKRHNTLPFVLSHDWMSKKNSIQPIRNLFTLFQRKIKDCRCPAATPIG